MERQYEDINPGHFSWMEQKGAYTVKTLIKNGIVITQDPQDQVWEKGWLLL